MLQDYANAFVSGDAQPWCLRPISIDMVKQFPMFQISSFLGDVFSVEELAPGTSCCIPLNMQGRFFTHICSTDSANEFLASYAPVADVEA